MTDIKTKKEWALRYLHMLNIFKDVEKGEINDISQAEDQLKEDFLELYNIKDEDENQKWIKLTKPQALMLLATGYNELNRGKQVEIMCKEYGDDEDWNEVTTEDLDTLQGDEYQTFEIWC